VPDGDDLIRLVYGSADFKAGVAAFMAKQRPAWQGR
jgi:enoyl-CoA hydratase